MTFSSETDIGNRALQHCGVTRISSFTENSKAAGEVSFCYDKLRRAELRRNVWRFATRRAALRPIGDGTMFLSPVLWVRTTTYALGAIVTDSDGYLWQSQIQDNVNAQPGTSNAWEAYCGPLTAQEYDSTEGYFAGELVYETPGDGTFLLYMSLQNGNTQDPRAPTEWLSTTQYSKDQVVLFYAAWAVGTTYAAGNGVSYSGIYYVSLAAGNVGNTPSSSPTKWVAVTTTLAPGYYDSTVAYTVGQFVTYKGLNYVCIAATTGNLPTNATYWSAQAVGTTYASLIDFNSNNDPSAAPALWASATTYASGNSVGASDGYIYTSVGNGNVGNDPVATTGKWTNTGVLNPWTSVNPFGTGADQWLQLNCTLKDLQIVYPIGSGPDSQTVTRNVYRLPANYLRKASQDPKAGSVSFLGAPSGLDYNDWLFEGNYIVTREVFPIVLRFVADLVNVSSFDDMFCELLAARVGMEVCEALTQSTAKLGGIRSMYQQFATEARMVNGIEVGAEEPPEDDFIACRV